MRFLSTLMMAAAFAVVAVGFAIAIDYADYLRNSREIQKLAEQSQTEQARDMAYICDMFRESQKTLDSLIIQKLCKGGEENARLEAVP